MISASISRRRFLAASSLAAFGFCVRPLRALAASSPITVKTPSGPLAGEQAGAVRVFRGVSFAEPPVGALRFRPPVPVKLWSARRDATCFRAAAMQSGEPGVEHSEDCLYLNLWAPEGKGPFPVYVWIHGGGFTGGHAFEPTFDGTELARQGIVCVTVAYRLGVFGFLDMEPLLGASYAGSANNGVRDLLAALAWVRSNIAAFGGDPARVTIGGESAGAKLTAILMGVPEARPLFHQMISESGGGDRVNMPETARAVAAGFLEQWRKQSGGPAASLVSAPAVELIRVQQRLIESWPSHFPLRAEVDGRLLPKRPAETIAGGSTEGKRLLIGTNRDESAAFVGAHPARDAGQAELGNMPAEKYAAVYAKYAAVYPEMSVEQRRIRALSAEEYWIPSMRVLESHRAGGGGSAFVYRLDFSESSGPLRGEARHGLDVPLVWNRPNAEVENAAAEAALAVAMQHAWVAFLRGEQPTAAGLPPWPAYNASTCLTMIFDVESRVESKPQEAELRLWDGVL